MRKVSPCRNGGWSQRSPHVLGFSWGSQCYVPIIQGLKWVFLYILSSLLVLYKHKGKSAVRYPWWPVMIFLLNFFPQFNSVQSLSHVRLFLTPWITARQASLSITNSRSLLKLMPIESVMPSSHLILCHPLLLLSPILPASRSFPMSQLFAWGGLSIGVSASASVRPMNTQDWSPLGWTGWISLQSSFFTSYYYIQIHLF